MWYKIRSVALLKTNARIDVTNSITNAVESNGSTVSDIETGISHDGMEPSIIQTGSDTINAGVSATESTHGILSFRNVNYIVGGGTKSCKNKCRSLFNKCLKPKAPKQVLFNVCGNFANGLNAILGPSGCGKSTLLDVLTDRKDSSSMSGSVLCDGVPHHLSLKYTIGYVVQEDIYCGTLTVRENLLFSANLRLPKNMSTTEKRERVSQVIAELSLESCADVFMGTELLRGVSGGEKKRTSIGMELILSPKILLLDEPTTGLDAFTARSVMNCLKQLSQGGRTIVFSIHQPRYSIFKLFDTAMFMCQGQIIFHGRAADAVPYFSKHGYQCEMYDNPSDFILDVLMDMSQIPDTLAKLSLEYNMSIREADGTDVVEQINLPVNRKTTDRLRHMFRVTHNNSIGAEILYIFKRTILDAIRNPALALSQIVTAIVISLLIGIVFNDLQNTIDPGIQNKEGAIFFITTSQFFCTLSTVGPFLQGRAIFIHEYVSGYYRIISYLIAKIASDILSMRLVPSIIFSIISYFMTGLTRTAGQFFIFLFTIVLISILGTVMCLLIAASTSIPPVALTVANLVFTVMMVFTGFLTNSTSIPTWISWLQWFSGFRYGFNMLIINEVKDLNFCLTNMTNICPITGQSVLNKLNIDNATAWDMWKNCLALAIMAVGYCILTFIQLLRMKKTK